MLAFQGSPRNRSNSSILLDRFLEGAGKNTRAQEVINPYELNLEYCRGCLRCNVLRSCATTGDDWEGLSSKILDSDVLVFASPVYFHHLPSALKKLIDRFRSFAHVQITETGLIHTPWQEWKKDFVLLLTMGSSDEKEAKPVIELFEFITSILGTNNKLHSFTAKRLALAGQILKNREELENVYQKLDLATELVDRDLPANKQVLQSCYELGAKLTV